MSSHSIKAPPALSKSNSYETWLKEIEIWKLYTDTPVEKQGPAIFLTLEGKAREAVLELDIKDISGADGCKNIVAKLNTLYLKDKAQVAYEAYDKFEQFQRAPEMTMKDFIIEFERLHCKTKSHGATMSDDILAYRLLKSANISNEHQQLARATMGDLKYDNMKSQLNKIFGDQATTSSSSDFQVKIENINEATAHGNDVYYGSSSNRGWPSYRSNNRGNTYRGRGTSGGNPSRADFKKKKGKNPLNEKGFVSRCSNCESINHWAPNCPDAQYFTEECDDTSSEHHITLFQSAMIPESSMKIFVAESLSAAILDSGASSTVSGEVWIDSYIEGLSSPEQDLVTYSDSSCSFKFGSGEPIPSLYKVKIPATIGEQKLFIETDVVKSDVPLLLSRQAMKKANTKINFKDDTVNMLGFKQDVIVTSSGHYAVNLNGNKEVLKNVITNKSSVILHTEFMNGDKKKIANKLHHQFSHPEVGKLIQLVKNAGMGHDTELISNIKEVSASCKICLEYKKPSPRPVVGLPLATTFNEVVAMDLKMIDGHWVLHLIDHVSRFSAASFVSSKKPEEIIQKIFEIWITVFGPPSKFFSDNGGEFNNEKFRTFCESMNITIKTTAAESPWSNGLCERHNAVLADVYSKTIADAKCSRKTALYWAIHSKNSLANVHGFSPYQLAIGYTPRLPNVLSSSLPAMENFSSEKHLLEMLQSMSAARKAFIQAENSERIKRALRHNIRPSSNNKFLTGDSVFYKRNDERQWRGPGKVIGTDSQQVLIKHGSIYVRVHPCRILLDRKNDNNEFYSGDNMITHQETKCDAVKTRGNNAHQIESSSENESEETEENYPDANKVESSSEDDSEEPNDSFHDPDSETGTPVNGHSNIEPQLTPANENPSSNVFPKLKKGMNLTYKNSEGRWISGKVLGRAGKSTGKYKMHWNFERNEDKLVEELNFDDVSEWKENPEICEDEYVSCHVNTILMTQVNDDIELAKKLELENWTREMVYEEVDNLGQSFISVRWVVTPKLINGEWKSKARLVARGFEEDSSKFRSDSPTCMKESIRVMLATSASCKWDVNSFDIKAAFLQGKLIQREVYLKPPKEAKSPEKLWKLRKVVYGLSDASRVWYLRVVEELSKLNVHVSPYDKATFTLRNSEGLQGIMIVHVDDFLWAGSDLFISKVINPIKQTFKISKESTAAFKYVGVDLEQNKENISVHQYHYIDSLKPIEVDTSQSTDPKRFLVNNERKEFQMLVGQIHWSVHMSRPDMAFHGCDLGTVQTKPKLSDLKRANKYLRDMKSDKVSLKFRCLDLSSIELITYADASYGNLPNGGSQGGYIIFLCDKYGRCSPISWCSRRIKRVARSTLSAETQAAVEALDAAYLMKKFIGTILDRSLKVTLRTDNKSLFDAIRTTNLSQDKRLRVDLAALREMNDNDEVNFEWVDSKNQIADVLTKIGASKRNLLQVLQHCCLA